MTLKADITHGVDSLWVHDIEVLCGVKADLLRKARLVDDVLRELVYRTSGALGLGADNAWRGSGSKSCCGSHDDLVLFEDKRLGLLMVMLKENAAELCLR